MADTLVTPMLKMGASDSRGMALRPPARPMPAPGRMRIISALKKGDHAVDHSDKIDAACSVSLD
jgi:hypothetical protein